MEGWMVMFSLTCTPWHSITENNLRIFIAELSDFNRKIASLEKWISYKTSSPAKEGIFKWWWTKGINCNQNFDNNVRLAVYTGEVFHGICYYLEMIGSPNTLTNSGKRYHRFGPSYSTNNYTATLHPVIADLRMIQKSICEYHERIEHKADDCIICGPKCLPLSLRRKMNKLNATKIVEHPNSSSSLKTQELPSQNQSCGFSYHW